MQLTALVDRLDHVCCRYRLAAFRPFLEEAGHYLELEPWPRRWWSWLPLRRRLQATDVVILQRRLLSNWQLHLVRRSARYFVFDFDDAVFLRDSYAAKGLHSSRRQRHFAAMVRASDAVVAGNDFLAKHAFGCGALSDRVHSIPTCIDPGRYSLAEHQRADSGVQLVWVGSSSTLRGLEAIRPLLDDVGQRVPGLRLKLICDRFFSLTHLPVIECPWSEEREAAEIAAADIGISWVPDDLWSRGKCGLKVLQYMAAGLPVVANPVGVQAEMVRPGETGFLAETPGQWAEAIRLLAQDPDLRRRMGQAGRRLIETDFSVAAGAQRWITLLNRLQQRVALTG